MCVCENWEQNLTNVQTHEEKKYIKNKQKKNIIRVCIKRKGKSG
jgi:hypothetical protein